MENFPPAQYQILRRDRETIEGLLFVNKKKQNKLSYFGLGAEQRCETKLINGF
jgi:hypothetical protein